MSQAIELLPDTLSLHIFGEGTIAILLLLRSKAIIEDVTEGVGNPCFQVPERCSWRNLYATLQKWDGLNTIMSSGQIWGYNPDLKTLLVVGL